MMFAKKMIAGGLVLLTSLAFATKNVRADHRHNIVRHAQELQILAHALHEDIEHQLNPSPFAERMCEYASRLEREALRIEELALTQCSPSRLWPRIDSADRMVGNLRRMLQHIDHRVRIGLDPPMGCTQHIHRKIAKADELVCCLRDEVRAYRPVPVSRCRNSGYDRYDYDHVDRYRSRGSSIYIGDRDRGISFGNQGVTLHRGGFSFSFK